MNEPTEVPFATVEAVARELDPDYDDGFPLEQHETRMTALEVLTTTALPRSGSETFTGEHHPVVFDQARADQDLPPWTSTLDGQHFHDHEVEER